MLCRSLDLKAKPHTCTLHWLLPMRAGCILFVFFYEMLVRIYGYRWALMYRVLDVLDLLILVSARHTALLFCELLKRINWNSLTLVLDVLGLLFVLNFGRTIHFPMKINLSLSPQTMKAMCSKSRLYSVQVQQRSIYPDFSGQIMAGTDGFLDERNRRSNKTSYGHKDADQAYG